MRKCNMMTAAMLAAALGLVGLTGCGSQGGDTADAPKDNTTSQSLGAPAGTPEGTAEGEGSRAELYTSLDDLAAGSSLIVVAKVASQEVKADIKDAPVQFTISTVDVLSTLKGEPNGSSIIVRETGTPQNGERLKEGGTYALFLTPSGLDGDLASHYYILGAEAGAYTLKDGQDAAQLSTLAADAAPADMPALDFERMVATEGDTLPQTATLADIATAAAK